jgi:threonyl-tRNA synthetase
MKILLIHADFVEFGLKKKAMQQAENWQGEDVTRIEDCLVVFTAVEKKDEGKIDETVKNMMDEVDKVAKDIKAERIVIYPYAHLSSELSSPATAQEAILKAEESAKERGFDAYHAAFGWYKSFNIKTKGHPMSELSRDITAEKVVKKERGGVQSKEKAGEEKKLSENDHRTLGTQLDLYSFQKVAPGMTFYHPNGTILRNELMDFSRKEQTKRGYQEISTPVIMNKSLWLTSGHWDHYNENMFFTEIDDDEFAIKPMNCPGSILVFKSQTRSYRDLPLRLSEYGMIHRNELSGVLSGLFRVRQFVQDDAHIYVTEEQMEEEIEKVVEIIDHFYKAFGFEYHVELSTKPDNAMGSTEVWEKAEKTLEEALKKKGMKYKINEGDGAFYGPKIDFHIKDSLGRTWQCGTCQLDFMMPERFDINYVGEDNKQHKPVMIHRVIYGALERFLGILVEHYKGAFPLWLAPVQVRVLGITDKNATAVSGIVEKLKEVGIRADTDSRQTTIDYRVREAEMQKIPKIVVIGDKEELSGKVAVRTRGNKEVEFDVDLEEFIYTIKEEIKEKK